MTPHSPSRRPGKSPHRIKRIGKACEPCRARKTKCDILERYPCGECVKRSLGQDCVQRDQARRRRRTTVVDPESSSGSSKRKQTLPTTAESVSDLERMPETMESPFFDERSASANSLGPSHFAIARGVPNDPVGSDALLLPPQYAMKAPQISSAPSRAPINKQIGTLRGSPDRVENMLYSLLETRCPDLDIDLSISSERLIDLDVRSLTLDNIGLTPGSPRSLTRARHWIHLHFTAIHHNTPFLHRPTIEDIAQRYFRIGSENETMIGLDERALLFIVLALGSFRENTWDIQDGRYQQVIPLPATSLEPHLTSMSHSTSALLSDLSQRDLNRLDAPSELAVQALFLIHTYVANTSLGRWSRDFVARAVMMSHEIGLNRLIPPSFSPTDKQTPDVAMRRAVLYLYVLFADVYLSALDNNSPLIKTKDYDPGVFDPILHPPTLVGSATPSTSPSAGLSAFVDLVRTGGEVLESWRGKQTDEFTSTDIIHVLELEQRMDDLRDRLGDNTFTIPFDSDGEITIQARAVLAGRLLRQIHYNWLRIAVRQPYLQVPLLAHSSLAICARSAMSLLTQYRHILSGGFLNLPWMQLRRIATSIEIVFIAFLKGELLTQETEEAIENSLVLFAVLGTRWQGSNKLASAIRSTSTALGLRTRAHADVRNHYDATQAQPSSLDTLLSILPSNTDSAPPSTMHDLNLMNWDLGDLQMPGFDSLNTLWGQSTPIGIDMMDGFDSWIASNGFSGPQTLTLDAVEPNIIPPVTPWKLGNSDLLSMQTPTANLT